ncbi:hypothetical protein [Arhodomonas sp. SL1]|uniref:hypothetical protein n=1 Tax=Arhodomonas sp. SL1 TaxID=3425691 RepID=UPI003F880ACA
MTEAHQEPETLAAAITAEIALHRRPCAVYRDRSGTPRVRPAVTTRGKESALIDEAAARGVLLGVYAPGVSVQWIAEDLQA